MCAKITVHTKKFYRVVLESIDPARENPETFAIKFSMRARTPMPRAKQIARNLPIVVKQGIAASQANSLKAMLEDIGGIARLESYFVTPGERDFVEEAEVKRQDPENAGVVSGKTRVCPSCGGNESEDAEHCGFCYEKLQRNQASPPLGQQLPDENPLDVDDTAARPFSVDDLRQIWEVHKLQIVIGAGVLLLLIAIFK